MIYKMDFPTVIAREGNVKFLIPDLKAFTLLRSDYAPSMAPVFYNPVMEFNRDVSVLALRVYQRLVNHEISACDPLTGCGIRGIRYATEVKNVRKIVMNDINKKAVELASLNVQMNSLAGCAIVEHEEANRLLNNYSAPHMRFDAVDVDPFGTPVPFLESSIRALRSGGLLAATATDMAPLCGVHPNACIRKYGGRPLRTEYCHELAVRLLAGALAKTAARHDIGVRVMFSHYADHYVRVYARVKYGAKEADKSLRRMGYVFHCFKCFHREIMEEQAGALYSQTCRECGGKLSAAGPLWIGEIVDKQFAEIMKLEAERQLLPSRRIEKTLSLAAGEANAPATYYDIDAICDHLNMPVPSVKTVADRMAEKGLEATRTHFSATSLKSNVSSNEIKNIILQTIK